MGIVTRVHENGIVIVENYICSVSAPADVRYIKRSSINVHENNLQYVGFKSVEKYNKVMAIFIKKQKEETLNKESTDECE